MFQTVAVLSNVCLLWVSNHICVNSTNEWHCINHRFNELKCVNNEGIMEPKKRSKWWVERHLVIRWVCVATVRHSEWCPHSSAFLWSLINFMAYHLSDAEAELGDKTASICGSHTGDHMWQYTCQTDPLVMDGWTHLLQWPLWPPISCTDRITRRGILRRIVCQPMSMRIDSIRLRNRLPKHVPQSANWTEWLESRLPTPRCRFH